MPSQNIILFRAKLNSQYIFHVDGAKILPKAPLGQTQLDLMHRKAYLNRTLRPNKIGHHGIMIR